MPGSAKHFFSELVKCYSDLLAVVSRVTEYSNSAIRPASGLWRRPSARSLERGVSR